MSAQNCIHVKFNFRSIYRPNSKGTGAIQSIVLVCFSANAVGEV